MAYNKNDKQFEFHKDIFIRMQSKKYPLHSLLTVLWGAESHRRILSIPLLLLSFYTSTPHPYNSAALQQQQFFSTEQAVEGSCASFCHPWSIHKRAGRGSNYSSTWITLEESGKPREFHGAANMRVIPAPFTNDNNLRYSAKAPRTLRMFKSNIAIQVLVWEGRRGVKNCRQLCQLSKSETTHEFYFSLLFCWHCPSEQRAKVFIT